MQKLNVILTKIREKHNNDDKINQWARKLEERSIFGHARYRFCCVNLQNVLTAKSQIAFFSSQQQTGPPTRSTSHCEIDLCDSEQSTVAGTCDSEQSTVAGIYDSEQSTVAGTCDSEQSTVAGTYDSEQSTVAGTCDSEQSTVAGTCDSEQSTEAGTLCRFRFPNQK